MSHIMLSYELESQELVKAVYDRLTERGYIVWMDINISGDLNVAMAEAVEGAVVVCAFLTERYQKSKSCLKELSYADKINKMIVPCMAEQNYTATSWLGFVLGNKSQIDFTGSLNPDSLSTSVQSLVKEITAVCGEEIAACTLEPTQQLAKQLDQAKLHEGAEFNTGGVAQPPVQVNIHLGVQGNQNDTSMQIGNITINMPPPNPTPVGTPEEEQLKRCIADLTNSDEKVLEEAVRAIGDLYLNATDKKVLNKTTLLIESSTVKAMCKNLNHQINDVARLTARALNHIYFHTPDKTLLSKVTELLLAHGGVTAIIKNMQHTNTEVVRCSAATLNNIYFYTPDKTLLSKVTQLLLSHGGVTAIIKNMQHTNTEVVHWSASALEKIYFYTPDKTLLSKVTELLLAHDGITTIIKNLQHTNTKVVMQTSAALGKLYLHTPDKEMLNTVTNVMVEQGGFERAIKNVEHSNSEVVEWSVYLLRQAYQNTTDKKLTSQIARKLIQNDVLTTVKKNFVTDDVDLNRFIKMFAEISASEGKLS